MGEGRSNLPRNIGRCARPVWSLASRLSRGGQDRRREVELGQHVKGWTGAGATGCARLPARCPMPARAQLASATTHRRDLAEANTQAFRTLRARTSSAPRRWKRYEANLKAAQASPRSGPSPSSQASPIRKTIPSCWPMPMAWSPPWRLNPVRWLRPARLWCVAQDGASRCGVQRAEDRRSAIKPGQGVKVRPWSDESRMINAQVREVAASADPATRTYVVKAALQGTDLPALGATVHVMPGHGREPAKPQAARSSSCQPRPCARRAVTVRVRPSRSSDAASSSVKLQPVQIASADGNEAVIASGLQPWYAGGGHGRPCADPGQKVTGISR